MQWEEDGIAPQVVFEVLSPGNRAGEMERKLQFYERHGVDEYYIYDPDRGYFVGCAGQAPCSKRSRKWPVIKALGSKIRFEPGQGPDNLSIIGPDGERFLTYTELVKQRNANRERALEQTPAEEQAQAADRLAAQLRQLGIEPE